MKSFTRLGNFNLVCASAPRNDWKTRADDSSDLRSAAHSAVWASLLSSRIMRSINISAGSEAIGKHSRQKQPTSLALRREASGGEVVTAGGVGDEAFEDSEPSEWGDADDEDEDADADRRLRPGTGDDDGESPEEI